MLKLLKTVIIMSLISVPDAHAAEGIAEILREQFLPLLDQSLPPEKRYQSIIVGVVTPFETKIMPFGEIKEGGGLPSEEMIFEIGSITKGFLGLALAKDILEGRITLDQPVSSLASLKLPNFQGIEITWRDLANHTSGLPRLPDNIRPQDPLQPYLDYGIDQLESFLAHYTLKSAPGLISEYSNLGAGIVGYGLEQIHNKPLEEIFRSTILDQAGLQDTRIFLSPKQNQRTTPIFLNGEEISHWQWNTGSVMQGAGALKSTLSDMLKFLQIMMGTQAREIHPYALMSIAPTYSDGNSAVGLFWNRLNEENIVWHNGGTYGSSSFMGFDPDRLIGIVVLSNSQIIDERGIDPRLDLAAIQSLLDIAQEIRRDIP